MITRPPIIEVEDLRKYFERTKGLLRRAQSVVKAVDGVSLTIHEGETLSLVGESGCGKTTTGLCIIQAIDPTSGNVYYYEDSEKRNLVRMGREELLKARQSMRMVFQDPFSSLNPRMTISQIIGEPLLISKRVKNKDELRERVAELLSMVHLDPKYMNRYPHAFSGGQRQRIAIARALALDPRFVIADEPVSALDVSVQAQILNLLKELQVESNLTYLFIAHDLAVVRYQSDRIAVMYLGRIVELSTRDEIFDNPLHPYTELLLASSPIPDPGVKQKKIELIGEIPDPAHRPTGCDFHPRCRYAENVCREEEPDLIDISSDDSSPHFIACHLWDRLSLLSE